MDEPKILNNSAIVNARTKLAKAVNDILADGVPISVVAMYLHLMADDADKLLAQILENEKKTDSAKPII